MPTSVRGKQSPFTADADLAPYTILKYGSVDGNCATAATSTDRLLGISDNVPIPAGQVASVCRTGTPLVQFGGPANPGDYLTSDANGHAIVTVPAAGVNVSILGTAEETSAVGDIRPVFLTLGRIQG